MHTHGEVRRGSCSGEQCEYTARAYPSSANDAMEVERLANSKFRYVAAAPNLNNGLSSSLLVPPATLKVPSVTTELPAKICRCVSASQMIRLVVTLPVTRSAPFCTSRSPRATVLEPGGGSSSVATSSERCPADTVTEVASGVVTTTVPPAPSAADPKLARGKADERSAPT